MIEINEIESPNSIGFIQDDMLFVPYENGSGGWQCKINTQIGVISVRLGGWGLTTTPEFPYEVWYPTEKSPTEKQSASDIWGYIKQNIRQ
jgi:hypothetical protein